MSLNQFKHTLNEPLQIRDLVASGTPQIVPGASLIAHAGAVAQSSTSGTQIDFTGIPSWVKRITVMFNGVSTNGTSVPIIQLGAGGVTTTGYTGATGYAVNAAASVVTAQTTGFPITPVASSTTSYYAIATIALISTNTWVFSISGYQPTLSTISGGGSISLSGTLDRVRFTTVNGIDTFKTGSVNLMYE